jgi:iron-only hydrogenase group A
MPTINVNGKSVRTEPRETLLEALRREGIRIPTLCHWEGLPAVGACRLCVVELEGQANLVPACATPVVEGMRVHTHSARVVDARKTIIELLLSNHPDDCLYCPRKGTCELLRLATELGVTERTYRGARIRHAKDVSSPSLVRDPEKCILCGRCVRVCSQVQGVGAIDFTGRGAATLVAPAFIDGLNVSTCVHCGQCVMACPTGALTDARHLRRVTAALDDPDLTVVVQHAPSVSVTLGEYFNFPPGTDVDGLLVAALRRLGFDVVFDTSFTADLTVMEEASELVERIRTHGPLPMFTSCSPAWVRYVETFHPRWRDHVSTCKSPQQMMGSLIKNVWARRQGVPADRIFSVSVMPCTAKKAEARRPEMLTDGRFDVDAVLTVRELAELIVSKGIDFRALDPAQPDHPFGTRSSSGKLFGATGGVLEAALRTACFLLTGENPTSDLTALRDTDGVRELALQVGGTELRVVAVSGLAAAARVLEEIEAGHLAPHLVEVMSCPGGCVAGGGQPHGQDATAVAARMQALHRLDRGAPLRFAHENPEIRALYEAELGEPLGETSHHLLHTHQGGSHEA